MRLEFYDFGFNKVHTETRCISTRERILYNGVGTFEAHFPLESDAVKAVFENIRPSDGKMLVVKKGDFSAIVVGYEIREDFTVFGRTCNWLLSKRLVPEKAWANQTIERFVRYFVDDAFGGNYIQVKTLNDADKTAYVSVAKDTDALTAAVSCLGTVGYGHSVDFDVASKKFIYCARKGKEVNVPIRSAYDSYISFDILDYANCGYYDKAVGSASVRTYLSPSTSGGKKPIALEAKLSGDDYDKALSDLANYRVRDEAGFKLQLLKYKKDYDLGDTVRLQVNKGALKCTLSTRIIGVEIESNSSGVSEQPLFEEDYNGNNKILYR